MANNLIIAFVCERPSDNRDLVLKSIRDLGPAVEVFPGLWYAKSSLLAADAARHIWPVMGPNDGLIVVDASNDSASWFTVSEAVSDFLKEHWHRASATRTKPPH